MSCVPWARPSATEPCAAAQSPDDIGSDYLERLIRERWGEDYEDNAEFHQAEARSHEMVAEQLRNLARDLDDSAQTYESLAETERERARDCEKP